MTEPNETPLKPCPFCGGAATHFREMGDGYTACSDPKCGGRQAMRTEQWNRRDETELAAARAELADNERWMREVLTDWKIPYDDHKVGRRLAFTQWMQDARAELEKVKAELSEFNRTEPLKRAELKGLRTRLAALEKVAEGCEDAESLAAWDKWREEGK